ncbi:3D domain-containing protein [Pontibacillus salipaludis]|uniref:3D domain-containing protein n=1 Tax=Pontibacillus salipaludis TaxID=1697394 RepID=UPI0031E5EB60
MMKTIMTTTVLFLIAFGFIGILISNHQVVQAQSAEIKEQSKNDNNLLYQDHEINKQITLQKKNGVSRFLQTSAETHTSSKKGKAIEQKKAYTKEITVEATAYTAHCEGCSGITRTGINLLENPNLKVIAVDPTVIPLGTKVYIEGYGTAVAGDIGSAIKGNRIDIYMKDRQEALDYGRRTIKIKIIS